MRYFIEIEDETLEVVVDGESVTVDGESVDARLESLPGGAEHLLHLEGRVHPIVPGTRSGDTRVLHLGGRRVAVSLVDERTRRIREMRGVAGDAVGPRPLKASMPGLVVKVEVEEGQAVSAGDGLVIVEAMKMENELRAEADAVVARVLVEAGQAVEKDQVLVDFVAPDDGGEKDGAGTEAEDAG